MASCACRCGHQWALHLQLGTGSALGLGTFAELACPRNDCKPCKGSRIAELGWKVLCLKPQRCISLPATVPGATVSQLLRIDDCVDASIRALYCRVKPSAAPLCTAAYWQNCANSQKRSACEGAHMHARTAAVPRRRLRRGVLELLLLVQVRNGLQCQHVF